MKIIILLVVIVTTILMSACSPKDKHSAGEKLKEIRVSLPLGSSVFVAKKLGLFEKALTPLGVKVTYVYCQYGPPTVEAFIADRIDVAVLGDQPSLVAWAKGVDVKAVANFPANGRNTGLSVVDTNKIKTLQDLKGKKIAVSLGTVSQHLLHIYLKSAGLTEKDVNILNLVGADAIVALNSKQIDAAVLGDPNLTLCEHKKIAFKIIDAKGFKEYNSPLLVSGNLQRNNPEVVQKLVEVFYETNAWVIDHTEEAREIIYKESGYNIPDEVFKKIIRYGSKDLSFTAGALTENQKTLDYIKEVKFINTSFNRPLSEFYDTTFVSKLYSQGKTKK